MAILLVALAASIAMVLCVGCGGGGKTTPSKAWQGEDDVYPGEADGDTTGAVGNGADTIYMCGRSVLGGWFDHWGWDYEDPVVMDGYDLVYVEMDVPPGIVDTAQEAAREAAEDGVRTVFFKLCFDDFEGGDEYAAQENLENNERMIEEIVATAVDEEGLTLILGNALPKVREYSDEWLVWNHREFNRFLDELADAYGGRVIILDLYGTLAAPGGWLRPEYAADPYDSHLNDAAYDALDRVLSGVLGGL
jgi:hypothetical protein